MIATSPVSATSLTPESIDLLPQLDCRIDRSQTSFCDQHGNFPETDSANGEAIVRERIIADRLAALAET